MTRWELEAENKVMKHERLRRNAHRSHGRFGPGWLDDFA